jgi:hypothetical protein
MGKRTNKEKMALKKAKRQRIGTTGSKDEVQAEFVKWMKENGVVWDENVLDPLHQTKDRVSNLRFHTSTSTRRCLAHF